MCANIKPTRYSILIGDILKFRVCESNEKDDKNSLETEMMTHAEERYNDLISCWKSQEFKGTISHEWADKRTDEDRINTCKKLVEDALNYIDLVLKWHIFVRAIQRLHFEASRWLFENVY